MTAVVAWLVKEIIFERRCFERTAFAKGKFVMALNLPSVAGWTFVCSKALGLIVLKWNLIIKVCSKAVIVFLDANITIV